MPESRAEDYFTPRGEGSRHALFPGVDIATTAGQGMMISVVTIAPGAVVPDHSHPHERVAHPRRGRASGRRAG